MATRDLSEIKALRAWPVLNLHSLFLLHQWKVSGKCLILKCRDWHLAISDAFKLKGFQHCCPIQCRIIFFKFRPNTIENGNRALNKSIKLKWKIKSKSLHERLMVQIIYVLRQFIGRNFVYTFLSWLLSYPRRVVHKWKHSMCANEVEEWINWKRNGWTRSSGHSYQVLHLLGQAARAPNTRIQMLRCDIA